MLLASPGKPFSNAAVETAVELAGPVSIRVLSVARIYGTALGLQHPGLLPSKQELAAQEEIVADAIKRIEKAGGKAKGEVVATRNNAKTFLRAAERYSVRHVVLDRNEAGRLRRLLEGDAASSLRRQLTADVSVRVVGSGPGRVGSGP